MAPGRFDLDRACAERIKLGSIRAVACRIARPQRRTEGARAEKRPSRERPRDSAADAPLPPESRGCTSRHRVPALDPSRDDPLIAFNKKDSGERSRMDKGPYECIF